MNNRRRRLTASRTSTCWFLAVSTLAGTLSLVALTPSTRADDSPLTSRIKLGGGFPLQGTVTAYDAARGVITARIGVAEGGAPGKGEKAPASSLKLRTFEIKVSPKPGQTYPVGKKVYTNATTTQALVTSLPISGTKRDDIGQSSRRMETSIVISATGRIDGVTRTWTSEAARGFTGGVVVLILDKDGNVLHKTQLRKYGVNGTTVPGAPSDLKKSWSDTVPPEVISAAGGYAICHTHEPTERWRILLTDTEEGMQQVARIAVAVGEVVAVIAAL